MVWILVDLKMYRSYLVRRLWSRCSTNLEDHCLPRPFSPANRNCRVLVRRWCCRLRSLTLRFGAETHILFIQSLVRRHKGWDGLGNGNSLTVIFPHHVKLNLQNRAPRSLVREIFWSVPIQQSARPAVNSGLANRDKTIVRFF